MCRSFRSAADFSRCSSFMRRWSSRSISFGMRAEMVTSVMSTMWALQTYEDVAEKVAAGVSELDRRPDFFDLRPVFGLHQRETPPASAARTPRQGPPRSEAGSYL